MTKLITNELLTSLTIAARSSPRGRQHFNLHESHDERCQRFLNAVLSQSYIRPHRHSLDPKTETLIALRGTLGVLTFNDNGDIIKSVIISAGNNHPEVSELGIEISAGEWHTVVALTDEAILLEVKAGPFDPSAAKELANWAPVEGSTAAAAYLGSLRFAILNQQGSRQQQFGQDVIETPRKTRFMSAEESQARCI